MIIQNYNYHYTSHDTAATHCRYTKHELCFKAYNGLMYGMKKIVHCSTGSPYSCNFYFHCLSFICFSIYNTI